MKESITAPIFYESLTTEDGHTSSFTIKRALSTITITGIFIFLFSCSNFINTQLALQLHDPVYIAAFTLLSHIGLLTLVASSCSFMVYSSELINKNLQKLVLMRTLATQRRSIASYAPICILLALTMTLRCSGPALSVLSCEVGTACLLVPFACVLLLREIDLVSILFSMIGGFISFYVFMWYPLSMTTEYDSILISFVCYCIGKVAGSTFEYLHNKAKNSTWHNRRRKAYRGA